jgi:gamma-glutamyl-gamma-aminobutyrate hydrolase PuuD
MEAALLAEAFKMDLPVLAICRGLQLLNVVRGGTLHQNIPGHKAKDPVEHEIAIRPESRVAAILGRTSMAVNSRHHQAVDRLGRGLAIVAQAPDGTVEALEDPERRFVVAVQWHPEDRVDCEPDRRLFDAFARAVTGGTSAFLSRITGRIDSKETDLASRVDEILYGPENERT